MDLNNFYVDPNRRFVAVKDSFEIVNDSRNGRTNEERLPGELNEESSAASTSSSEAYQSLMSDDSNEECSSAKRPCPNRQLLINLIENQITDEENLLKIYYDVAYYRGNLIILQNVCVTHFRSKKDCTKLINDHASLLLRKYLEMRNITIRNDYWEDGSDFGIALRTARYVQVMEFVLLNLIQRGHIRSIFQLNPLALTVYKDILVMECVKFVNHIYEFDEQWVTDFIERHNFCGMFPLLFTDHGIDQSSLIKQSNETKEQIKIHERLQAETRRVNDNGDRRAKSERSTKCKKSGIQLRHYDNSVVDVERAWDSVPLSHLFDADEDIEDEEMDESDEEKSFTETPYPPDMKPIEKKSVTLVARSEFPFQFENELALQISGNTLDKANLTPFAPWNHSSVEELNTKREMSCDCGKKSCNGCFPKCYRCASYKCKLLCRYIEEFSEADLIYALLKFRQVHPEFMLRVKDKKSWEDFMNIMKNILFISIIHYHPRS